MGDKEQVWAALQAGKALDRTAVVMAAMCGCELRRQADEPTGFLGSPFDSEQRVALIELSLELERGLRAGYALDVWVDRMIADGFRADDQEGGA